MTAPKSIMLAIELVSAEREQARNRLQQARQADAYARAQMKQLTDYLSETDQRWMTGVRGSVSPELLHHHYQFLSRLTQAIEIQQGVLEGGRQRIDAAQQEVLAAELRLASFKQLLATRRNDSAKRLRRQEQKQMDEFATVQVQRQRLRWSENPA